MCTSTMSVGIVLICDTIKTFIIWLRPQKMLILTIWVKIRFTSLLPLRHPIILAPLTQWSGVWSPMFVNRIWSPLSFQPNWNSLQSCDNCNQQNLKIRMKGSKVWSQESSSIGFSVVLWAPLVDKISAAMLLEGFRKLVDQSLHTLCSIRC